MELQRPKITKVHLTNLLPNPLIHCPKQTAIAQNRLGIYSKSAPKADPLSSTSKITHH